MLRDWKYLAVLLTVLAFAFALAAGCGSNSSDDDDDDDSSDDDDDGDDDDSANMTDCETICETMVDCEVGGAGCVNECEGLDAEVTECLLIGVEQSADCGRFDHYVNLCTHLGQVGYDEGDRMEDFVLLNQNGDEVELYDYAGLVIQISVGAGWCPPCKQEAPVLQEIYNDYKDQGFTVLSILFEDGGGGDPDQDFLFGWANRYGLEFPVIGDPNADWAGSYMLVQDGAWPIPQNFFVDRDMKLDIRMAGFSEPFARTRIEKLLED